MLIFIHSYNHVACLGGNCYLEKESRLYGRSVRREQSVVFCNELIKFIFGVYAYVKTNSNKLWLQKTRFLLEVCFKRIHKTFKT